ncbi:hypothetical protein CON15_19775 [Bacillus cereus]|uniref:Uncharacterized protein n=1 Tax=Bacillus thuringiensis TaxID=1428 RepID=A0A9X6U4W9_BACTU|nr:MULTISPECIES: hypothetical protein [Bacillus cereus group]PDZ55782.1 hypothetical protein CON15_19775 [Bacillus cereus]PED16447.1 hypothetical protein CON01_00935 [Bacillus thuringiensis]PFC28555.1 hypothetical protein CN299_19995 [Bacillus thuringiensis]PFO26142.1 hypothetical protein COJ78_29000 [Bacillus thuringiensis]PFS40402.1 hypothetical protein COK48_00730 [Bacillus thuringiensis]
MKKQLFVGELTPCEEHITPVRNEMGMNKPRGGFWTSTYINEEHGSDWVLWSLGNEFYTCTNSTSWLLTPSTGARIATVDSHQDLVELTEKYKAKNEMKLLGASSLMTRFDHLIDYEKLSQDYDAFRITEKGQMDTRFSHPHNLYGFDCESTVWFRWCFDKVEKLDKSYY